MKILRCFLEYAGVLREVNNDVPEEPAALLYSIPPTLLYLENRSWKFSET
jgi:hypothetical protein